MTNPKAALSALLGAKASRYDEGLHGPAPYERSKVSMPLSAGNCLLVDALGADDRADVLGFQDRLMLSEAEVSNRVEVEGRANIYWDPVLKHNEFEYTKFILDLQSRRMLRFGLSCKNKVGVFLLQKRTEHYD